MITIKTIPTEKFTTNTICVLVRQPLQRVGVTSTALLPPLLARGSTKYPTIQDIRLAAEAMQGSIFDAQIIKKGEHQIMQFFLEYVNADSSLKKRGISFLHEIINNPRVQDLGFYSPYVQGEKENLKNRIDGRINNRSEYAKLKCFEAMCKDEPFGIYGDGYAEDLSDITSETLFSHYTNQLKSCPIDIIALGQWDEAWLKNEISHKFGKVLDEKGKKIKQPSLYKARRKREIIKINHGAAQGNLCIGLRGEIPTLGMDFVHFQLANEILGGGPNARLFTNIREKESLCYSIYSTIFRFKSLMCIIAGCEPDKMEFVLELAEKEIDVIKKGGFSEAEFYSAKQSMFKRFRTMQDKPSACVDFYASQYLLNDGSTVDDLIRQIEKATPEGVAQVMSNLDIDTVVMLS